eukprot:534180-Ditylum_brightwellii.AAC.1
MLIAWVQRWCTVELIIPHAVELSVMTGVGGWGCPILVRASLSSSPFLVLEKRAPISALAADATGMILHTLCTGLLRGTLADGCLLWLADGSLRKKCPPAWLHACGSDMNKASECMWRTMPLACRGAYQGFAGCALCHPAAVLVNNPVLVSAVGPGDIPAV